MSHHHASVTPARRPTPSTGLRALFRAGHALAWAALAGTVLAVGVPSATAVAYPQPSIAPVAWELDFEYREPKRIVVQLPGESTPRAYWYMAYTVTNNTDEERLFLPEFELLAADGRVLGANRNIPMAVFNQIKQKTRSLDLIPPQQMVGRLLVGEDQAKSSVAIWQEPLAEMGTFDIFVGGLSGEVVQLKDSQGNLLTDENGDPILVRKTRQLRYKIRGDDYKPQLDQVDKLLDKWVMR